MDKAESNKVDFDAAQTTHKSNPLPRIGRMIVCVLSMGMVYPNAFIESVDVVDYEARSNQTEKK